MNKQTSFTSFISWCGKRVALAVPIILSLAYFGSGVAHAQDYLIGDGTNGAVVNNATEDQVIASCGALANLTDVGAITGTSRTIGDPAVNLAGGAHCYRVRATNAGGSSDWVYAIFTITAPEAATVTASVVAGGNTVDVVITRPSEFGNPAVTGFQVQRRLENEAVAAYVDIGDIQTRGTAGVVTTFTTAEDALGAGNYRFRVVSFLAENAVNNVNSLETAADSVVIQATGSSAPIDFEATYNAAANTVTLNWEDPATFGDTFANWDLNATIDGAAVTDITEIAERGTRTFVHSTTSNVALLSGREYVYQVSASSAGTDVVASATAVLTKPSVPTSVRLVLDGSGNLTLEWVAPAGERVTSYNVSSQAP